MVYNVTRITTDDKVIGKNYLLTRADSIPRLDMLRSIIAIGQNMQQRDACSDRIAREIELI